MKLLGAEVRPVQSGARTLKDAMNEALRDWVTNVADTFYCIGTCAGPHPYPAMVRDFQSVIGDETRVQMQEMEGRLPDSLSHASAAAPTHRPLHRSSTTRASKCTGSRRRATARRARRSCRIARRRQARRAAAQRTYLLMNETARSMRATRSRPASTIRHRPEHAC